jgi:hypothetical protein
VLDEDFVEMPYREKTAWLSLAAIAITFTPYFAIVAISPQTALPDLRQLGLFATVVISQAVILTVGHIYLALQRPQEARTPPDERDRAISTRSITAAYYVLIVGMIVVGCVMPFSSGGWRIINAAVFMIVLAELVHYGAAVLSYRRQA